MLRVRIIPVLLLRRKGLVKSIKFDKAKYIGDPINAVKLFNDKGVDELVFMDIDASKEGRGPDFELIEKFASECFMPLAYGGGIKSIRDVKRLFATGVEKVIINSAALHNLDLVTESSEIFGDQSIVVAIDVKKNIWGKPQVFSHAKLKPLKADVVEYARAAEKAGAGEIILNSVDHDGVMSGYDLDIINKVSSAIQIPLVACGGAGNVQDFKLAKNAGASALAAGSLFIYHGPHKAVLINFPQNEKLKALFEN